MPPKRAPKPRVSPPIATLPTKTHDGAAHIPPELSPAKNATTTTSSVGITQAQRQTLIDNLQLEITDRARKLRAQYALQAQGLRARLEMRVNRIPLALRKRTMGELLEEGGQRRDGEDAAAVVMAKAGRGVKRTSDLISTNNDHSDDNKENSLPTAPNAMESSSHKDHHTNPLPISKKRAKTTTTTAATANTKAPRIASRKPLPNAAGAGGGVLSPKSHNSRNLPRSPWKSMPPPDKPLRPTSPVKPAAVAAMSRLQPQRRGAIACEDRSSGSSGSSSSAGTTIVRKASSGEVKKARGKKVGGTAALGKTVATGRKVGPAAPPSSGAGGRTLRKRG